MGRSMENVSSTILEARVSLNENEKQAEHQHSFISIYQQIQLKTGTLEAVAGGLRI